MDLLSQRYANPYLLLDDFIRLGQLHDFSIEVLQMIQDDSVRQRRWEYYLHKVWKDMSFDEYVAICEKSIPEEKIIEKEEAVKIIEDSNKILEEFFT